MNKRALLLLLFLFNCFCASAIAIHTEKDSLLKILQLKDPAVKEKRFVLYVSRYLAGIDTSHLNAVSIELNDLMRKYNVPDNKGISYFIKAICLAQTKDGTAGAENTLLKAIQQANNNDDHYLLYVCFTRMAFLNLSKGNTLETISNYGLAKKEATILNDPYMQVLIDVNISDIYYKNNLYSQALYYLTEAQNFIRKYKIGDQMLENSVWLNTAELYFKMGRIDSLRKYSKKLFNVPNGDKRLYSFRMRTRYYIGLLQQNYTQVIDQLLQLKNDPAYEYDRVIDDQNLADAYFNEGKTDSAKAILQRMLQDHEQDNHPEIKMRLYENLALIAENENNVAQAAYNYKMAQQQASQQLGRMISIGTISSQIKTDELQIAYNKKEEAYRDQVVWLIFAIIVTVLTLIIGGMLYRNIMQKRYYEKKLYEAKRQELAFINSHEVRKHLSNIIGIVEMIRHSKDKHEEYLQAEGYLLRAAEDLDKAIRSISEKLDTKE